MIAHVLVVEDSPTQAEELRVDLEAAGYRVTLAAHGKAGFERFLEEQPDAVLTDIVMPEMDGYELCRAVKAHPTRGHTPVVLLTSLTDPGELLRALEVGADNFLRKPCNPDDLHARLVDVLQSRAEPRPGDERLEAEVSRVGRRVTVAFAKHQLLDLMFSSFEELIAANAALRAREENLRIAQAELRSLLAVTETERRRLAAVLDAIPEAMLIVERDGTVGHATAEVVALLGRPLETIIGAPVTDVLPLYEIHGPEPELLSSERHLVPQVLGGRPAAESGQTYGTWLPGDEGLRPVAVRVAGVPGPDGSTSAAVVVVADLGGLALRDRATGLAGPDLFAEHVGAVLAGADPGQQAAVLLVALDRFDALAEALGDKAAMFIAATAERLDAALSDAPEAVVGYLGRGEFALLLPPSVTPLAAETLARRLLEDLQQPVSVEGAQLASTVSVGLALAAGNAPGASTGPAAGATAHWPHFTRAVTLLRAAGTALRRARQRGGDCFELPDENLRNAALGRLRLESELRTAVAAGELTMTYKPEVRLATGEVVAVEGIISWPHPTLGEVDPPELIPLAREAGLVADIGAWALAEACRMVARWRRTLPGADGLQVAFGVTGDWLCSASLPAHVEAALADSGLPSGALVLNITEGSQPDDDAGRAAARELHRLGVEIAVADFGRRSSLQSPRHLGARLLILDPELVSAMSHDVADAALVAGVVRLAHGLGLQTLATGVSDDDQVMSLRLMGCDLAQGPFVAMRRTADEFERWWEAEHSKEKPATERGAAEQGASDPDARNGAATEDLRDEVITYLAHELRNPLATVSSAVQILDGERDRIDPSLHGLVTVLGRGASRLSRIIDTLHDIRAAHLGSLRVSKAPYDLAAEVRLALAEAPGLSDRNLRSRGPDSCPVTADAHRIRQVLDNLIGNAVKYTTAGTAIDVELDVGADLARLAVRDHGPGIPQDRRHELFRKFGRLGNPKPGVGLGLFLSRAIARAHGGDLLYEQPDGPGARFVLTLPTGG